MDVKKEKSWKDGTLEKRAHSYDEFGVFHDEVQSVLKLSWSILLLNILEPNEGKWCLRIQSLLHIMSWKLFE